MSIDHAELTEAFIADERANRPANQPIPGEAADFWRPQRKNVIRTGFIVQYRALQNLSGRDLFLRVSPVSPKQIVTAIDDATIWSDRRELESFLYMRSCLGHDLLLPPDAAYQQGEIVEIEEVAVRRRIGSFTASDTDDLRKRYDAVRQQQVQNDPTLGVMHNGQEGDPSLQGNTEVRS